MDRFSFWVVVVFLAIGTLSIRSSFFFLYSRLKISSSLRRSFSYIPAAVLPALVFPSVVFHEGTVDMIMNKERLLALILATVACYVSRSVVLTIVTGLMSLFLMTYYLG